MVDFLRSILQSSQKRVLTISENDDTPELDLLFATLPEKVDEAEESDVGVDVCRVCDGKLVVSDHRDKVARLLVDVMMRLRGLSLRHGMKLKAHVYWKVAESSQSGDGLVQPGDDDCGALTDVCFFCSRCVQRLGELEDVDSRCFVVSLLPELFSFTSSALDDLLVEIILYIRALQNGLL
jgi:hypothetical protein